MRDKQTPKDVCGEAIVELEEMYPVAFLCSKDGNKSLFCSRECLKVVLNKYIKDGSRYKRAVRKDNLVVKLSRRKNFDLFNAKSNKK